MPSPGDQDHGLGDCSPLTPSLGEGEESVVLSPGGPQAPLGLVLECLEYLALRLLTVR